MARDIEEVGTSQPLSRTSSSTTSATNLRVRTKTDPILATCRVFSFVTVVASILCIAANVISAIRSFTNGLDIFDGIFRCYAVLIAVIVIIAETEWSFVIKFWKVLEYWAGRGMLQIFVAVMTRAFPNIYGERHDILLLQDVASYSLLACGVIYVVSGVLCLGFLKRARQNKKVSAQQAVKDLEVFVTDDYRCLSELIATVKGESVGACFGDRLYAIQDKGQSVDLDKLVEDQRT